MRKGRHSFVCRYMWNRPGFEEELHAPCLAVPVCSDSLGAIAILLFGPHENGNDIDQDECEMLSGLVTRGRRLRTRGVRPAQQRCHRSAGQHRCAQGSNVTWRNVKRAGNASAVRAMAL